VPRWIKGETPRPPLPDLIAEALTRLCGPPTRLAAADIGMTGPTSRGIAASWSPEAVVAAILTTTRSDAVTDDSTLNPDAAGLLTGQPLLGAIQPWLHLSAEPLPDPVNPGRLGMSDVQRIQYTTDAFRRLDNAHGGGLSRLAVVGQLQHVTQLARNGATAESVGRALFAAVADLASVAGWMTHDTGRHAEAQRYLLLGLQAASQAGPAGFGIAGHLLNCLARQANHLHRPHDALELVQAAQYGTRKLPPDRLRAVLATLEARSHAVLGNLTEVTRAARAAEEALNADPTEATPSWVAWFDEAEYQVTVGVCDLIAAEHDRARAHTAITTIQAGTRLRPAERTRSRAFDHVALARAFVRAGQLDGAAEATTTALDLLGHVSSTRVADRLLELDAELALVATPTASRIREQIREAVKAT
jgi:hypothetical protein